MTKTTCRSYDANGNLTSRTTGGQSFTLTYDAENRLVGVSGAATASFVYDGDGRRVKGTVNGVTSYYVGDHYEVSGGVVKKYYSAGGQRIALRSGGVLSWLLGSSRSGRKAPPPWFDGVHRRRCGGDGRGALQSIRRHALHVGDDADERSLHRAAGGGKPGAVLLRCALV